MRNTSARLALTTGLVAAIVIAGATSNPSTAAGAGQCAFGLVGRAPVGGGGVIVAAYHGAQTPGGIAQQCSYTVMDPEGGEIYTAATTNPWDIKATNRFNHTKVVASSGGPVPTRGGFTVAKGDRVTVTIYTTCNGGQCAASGFIELRD